MAAQADAGGSPLEPAKEPRAADAGSTGTPVLARRCATPRGVSGRPRDIRETVALLNALPRPTSMACFVESLTRPLQVYFTSSGLSAQPATDEDSPRTFIVNDRLFLAFVPDGPAQDLLEMGYRTAADRAIRAEIVFPLTRPVRAVDIADHIALTDRNTFCGNCHAQEAQTEDPFLQEQAFESSVIPPNPADEVALSAVRAAAERCDAAASAERCELLAALFGHGELRASDAFAR